MSSYFFGHCLDFNLITMFGFGGCAGLSGCCGKCVHMQSVGEKRNAQVHLFLRLAQYGTRGKCPSFSCNYFFLNVLKHRFMLMSVFNLTFESVPCKSNNL